VTDPVEPEGPGQPPEALDTGKAAGACVSLRSQIAPDALTAPSLGTERSGNGVIISPDGLILTIGYLIMEADTVWVTSHRNQVVPGYVLGYDAESGLGLVQALQPLQCPYMKLGDSTSLGTLDTVVVMGHGGASQIINAQVLAVREFAGYWEYVIDQAVFTAPAHPNWGGAAMVGLDGKLLGVGSLLVQQENGEDEADSGANMIVPVNLLKPGLDELRTLGKPARPPRPWLGWLVQDIGEHLVITSLYEGCPAHEAGLRMGDVVLEVAGEQVSELADLFRRIWQLGPAGVEVPLTVVHDGKVREIRLHSIDRYARMKSATLH